MAQKTELEKQKVLRQNNQEANALTRDCIEKALILLMEKKKFDEISISDITKRAGVSRTAYYRNYKSKEDILSGYMQNINQALSDVLKKFDPIHETLKSWKALLKAVKPLAPQYRLLLDAGYFEKMILEYAAFMNKSNKANNERLRYSNCYWAGAIFTILSTWIRDDMKTSVNRLARVGSDLMTKGIRTIDDYGNRCV